MFGLLRVRNGRKRPVHFSKVECCQLVPSFSPRARLEEPDLGYTAQVSIDRRLPIRLDHVGFDCLRRQIDLRQPPRQTTGGDAGTVGAHPFIERVDPEAEAMLKKPAEVAIPGDSPTGSDQGFRRSG